MMYSWSGSPKTMRGRSAPVIVCDEIDGYDRTKEGHPVSLLRKRAATFGDQSVVLEISTPTIKGESWIENAFESGDKRRFHVPCPHCGEHQVLHWANVHWDKDDNGTPLPETASYQCAHCGVLWSEAERRGAIRLGEWRAEKPFFGHASYHLSELYSTLCDLRSIVQSFLDAKAAGDLQTFINTSLAETWEEDGARVDEQALMSRAEDFGAEVPEGGVYLTAGVDMQEDRLELEVVAWGLGEESWSVDYRVLWGDPTQGQVWEELDEALDQTYSHANGAELSIMAACLDTGGGEGGYTQAAYEYARSRGTSRIYAIKGVGGFGRPIISKPTKVSLARKGRRVNLFPLGVDEIKVIVTRRLALQNPGPGYCHIPDDRDPEWFAQMCAEKLVTKYRKGHPFREWHQTRARNEAFDCRGYAYAALKIKKPNLKSIAVRLDDEGGEDGGAAKAPEETPSPTGQVKTRQRKRRARAKTGGYVKNY